MSILLDERGITWKDFATRIDRNAKNISSMKAQNQLVSIGFAVQVAEELHIPLDSLLSKDSINCNHNQNSSLSVNYPNISYLYSVLDKGAYSIGKSIIQIKPLNKTVCYSVKQMPSRVFETKQADISFEMQDCLSLIKHYEYKKSVLLVSIDRHTPEYNTEKIHTPRQAAQVMNSSNFINSIKQVESKAYPINRNYGAIYASGVTVFMDSDYQLLKTPYLIDIIAIPPIFPRSNPLPSPEIEVMKNKIRTFFDIAIIHKKKILVMPAFGCGSSNNNPEFVANIIRAVLFEEEYIYNFEKIVFSFIDDEYGQKNYCAFSKILQS